MGCLLRLISAVVALVISVLLAIGGALAIYFGLTWFFLDTAVGSWIGEKLMVVVFGIIFLLQGLVSGFGSRTSGGTR